MIRLAISVEGRTEEEFVNRLLKNHLRHRGIYTTPILIGRARGTGQSGGNVNVSRLAGEMNLLKHQFDAVTSLVDFYGFRGKGNRLPKDLIKDIKDKIGQVGTQFVHPYIQVHEFEGLLFSNVNAFKEEFDNAPVAKLKKIRSNFRTPEDINNNPSTIPSKRIKRLIPSYQKTVHGPILAEKIGLKKIRAQCPQFKNWLCQLESLQE